MSVAYIQKNENLVQTNRKSACSIVDSSSQGEFLQRKADMANDAAQRQNSTRPNNTGMPDNLKAGIESLSGYSMDDVHVHYNSSKPATVQALAYTQGTDIHVAPGQEKCLPHEAWHVAQQMAGRVSPTTNINGIPVNDNAVLEHEADVMGERAVQCKNTCMKNANCSRMDSGVMQCLAIQYGNVSPVPRDAEQIAKGQNAERKKGKKRKKNDIDILLFDDVEKGDLKDKKNNDAWYIKKNMMDFEKIYIVSHGLPAMGNQPARLVDEKNNYKDGNAIANVVKNLNKCFKDKVGDVKIEACCSSLIRNTNQSCYDRLFGQKQNSLVQDVANCLGPLDGLCVTGNSGYAKGTDYCKNGVFNTRGGVTELNHLSILYDFLFKNIPTKVELEEKELKKKELESYRTDATYILEYNLDSIKNVLAKYIQKNKQGPFSADTVSKEMQYFFKNDIKFIDGSEKFIAAFDIVKKFLDNT